MHWRRRTTGPTHVRRRTTRPTHVGRRPARPHHVGRRPTGSRSTAARLRPTRTRADLAVDDPQGPARDHDLVARPDRARLHDLLAIEIGAVGRAEILELVAVADPADLAMHGGDAGGLKAQVVAFASANRHGGSLEGQLPRRLAFFADRDADHGPTITRRAPAIPSSSGTRPSSQSISCVPTRDCSTTDRWPSCCPRAASESEQRERWACGRARAC